MRMGPSFTHLSNVAARSCAQVQLASSSKLWPKKTVELSRLTRPKQTLVNDSSVIVMSTEIVSGSISMIKHMAKT